MKTLPATIELVQAAQQGWDIVVIGAGPAGSVAAMQAARCGKRTLLIDRKSFPRSKVCGACVNGRAVGALRDLEVLDRVLACGYHDLRAMQIGHRQRTTAVDLNGGISISRNAFDVALIESAILAGVSFLPNAMGQISSPCPPGRIVRLKSGDATIHVTAKCVLAADGLSSTSLKHQQQIETKTSRWARIGVGGIVDEFPSSYGDGTIYMAVAPLGYVGLVRVESGQLNLAAALNAAWKKSFASLPEAVNHVLASAGFDTVDQIPNVKLQGTIPLTRRKQQVFDHRVLIVGDAAGYIEPFTGEGIAWAIAGGAAAAELAAAHLDDWSPSVGRQWTLTYGKIVRNRQFICSMISRALRSTFLVSSSLTAVRVFPSLPKRIIRSLHCEPGAYGRDNGFRDSRAFDTGNERPGRASRKSA